MIQTQPAEFSSFHGGITDYNVNGPTAKFLTGDNLDIIPSGKFGRLKQRNGFTLFESRIAVTDEVYGIFKYITKGTRTEYTLAASGDNLYLHNTTSWSNLGFAAPSYAGTPNVIFETWNKKVYTSGYVNDFVNNGVIRKIIEPTFDGVIQIPIRPEAYFNGPVPTYTPTSPGVVNTFIFAVVPKVTYTHYNRTYEQRGTPIYTTVTTDAIVTVTVDYSPGGTPPTVPSGVTAVYEIYRTTDGGTTFYFTGDTLSSTGGSVNVGITDVTLINNATLYTTGGVLENDVSGSIDSSKVLHIVDDIGYYTGSYVYPNRVWQSIPGNPEWTSGFLYADLDEDIQGLSSVKSTPIAITSQSAYRIDGKFDELGRGGMIPQRISEKTDCINFASVVQTEDGVFWCGKDAFYFTDGYTVIRLNEDWDKTHATFTKYKDQRDSIRGSYDKRNQRISWTLMSEDMYNSSATYKTADTVATLHLYFGVKQNAAFTLYRDNLTSDSSDDPSFYASALYFKDGDMYRGSIVGNILKHTDADINDYLIRNHLDDTTWVPTAVRWTYESCSFNYGTDFMRKFIPWMLVRCKKESDLAFQIQSNNDDGAIYKNLALINNTTAKNNSGYYEEMRRFPKGGLRCSTKSIRMYNPTIEQYVSDAATDSLIFQYISGTTVKNLALWYVGTLPEQPSGLIGKYIAFTAFPGLEFLIIAQSTDTIQILDPNLDLASMNTGTQYFCSISSVPYDQIFHLMGYTVHYAVFGKTHDKFQTSENPGGVSP